MTAFVFRELGRDESFDPLTLSPDTSFTQARFYRQWQEGLGRYVRRYLVSRGDKTVAYFQIVLYPLAFGKQYAYVPYGPVIGDFSEDFMLALKTKIKNIARKNNVVFVRMDFTPPPKSIDQKKIIEKVFRKSHLVTYHSAYFQPRLEWFLDLNISEEDILRNMPKNGRYSIHLAEKKGVTTEIISADFNKYFDDFYRLMSITASRNGFSLHSRAYYQNIFNHLDASYAYMVIARYQGEILVADVIIHYGHIANYVYGSSSNEHRQIAPTYLAQWSSICHAKKLGLAHYNFGGIASGDIYKGWEGLTAFKKKFGGREVRHSDFFDVVTQPFWYFVYNVRKGMKRRF